MLETQNPMRRVLLSDVERASTRGRSSNSRAGAKSELGSLSARERAVEVMIQMDIQEKSLCGKKQLK
jgi:hypothetical protein